jgi:predicted nucleic acid-binding protein
VSDDQLYLLDTSVIIRLLRRHPVERLVSRVTALVRANVAAINNVVRTEVLVGCKTESDLRLVGGRIDGLLKLPVTEETWTAAAKLAFELRRKGVTAAVTDLLIASSAMAVNAIVMHVDGDFDTIAAHSSLRVESYVGAAL